MSAPMQGRALHLDAYLSQMAINYRPQGFIADRVFPVVRVPKQSDKYVIFEQADLFRRETTARARGHEANKIQARVSSAGYYANNYALKADVTLEDRLNADPVFVSQFEAARVRRVQDGLYIDWEVRQATQLTTLANVGTGAAVGSAWTDYVNSDPLGDIWTKADQIQSATGYRPNKAIFAGEAWRNFRRHTDVIDKASNPTVTGGGNYPSPDAVAQLLEMEVLVGASYYNTAGEGLSLSLSPIWGDHVVLLFTPPGNMPSMEDPSGGYSFRWAAPGLPNMQVERHPYDSRRKMDEVEVGYYQDEVITASPLIALITNTGSSQ